MEGLRTTIQCLGHLKLIQWLQVISKFGRGEIIYQEVKRLAIQSCLGEVEVLNPGAPSDFEVRQRRDHLSRGETGLAIQPCPGEVKALNSGYHCTKKVITLV
ncbi:hypothetical protein CEXT_529341 [Caerostris extrusa]|uniref:Uncharacterized protein n=1 Tax=Caerostris extrusa TaxID=172846 RepID=A0AAV4T2B1_CAEEX|nr:hypothetical protein CEXT_529341 [Caerostris extrusa]